MTETTVDGRSSQRPSRCRLLAVVLGIAPIAIFSVLIFLWGRAVMHRLACGGWYGSESDVLYAYFDMTQRTLSSGDELPPTMFVWMSQDERCARYFSVPRCSGLSFETIRFASWTAQNVRDGLVTPEEILQVAEMRPKEDWEEIRPFAFCLDSDALLCRDPDVLVGFMTEARSMESSSRAFLKADGTVELVSDFEAIATVLRRDTEARVRLGIPLRPTLNHAESPNRRD